MLQRHHGHFKKDFKTKPFHSIRRHDNGNELRPSVVIKNERRKMKLKMNGRNVISVSGIWLV